MSRLKTRREFLRLSAMAGAGTLLAACAPAVPQVVEKVVTKEVEKEVVVTTAPEAKQPVKLIAWFADRRTINVMTQEMIKNQFEVRYPHISAEVQFVPESEIPAKMATAYAAGQAPDISALDESQLPGFLRQGFVHPVPDGVIDVRKEMGDRIAEVYQIGGKYYALPNGNMPQILYCNLDLLDKYGYTVDDIPSKWDDFVKWAKELTVWEGDEITQWGYTWVGAPWAWTDPAYQKGTFVYKNNKESNFDDPVFVEVWQFWLDLLDVHKLEFRNAPLGAPHERVAQGLAVTGTQSGFACGWFPTQYPNANWATRPEPTFSGEGPYAQANDDLGFCNTTQKQEEHEIEASWMLWRYLVGPDYQRRYCPLRGVNPALLELRKEEQFTESNPKWYGTAITARSGNYRTDGVWPAEASPLIWQDIVERVQNLGEPIEEVLADHKAKIDAILAEMDLPLLLGRDGWKAEWDKPEA
jgi:ABC-type glycerol-3-phosphate transport system substrate-binding protein